MEHYISSICESSLWDPNSIYSKRPDFTFCFQYSLLIWTPCFLLWFAAPLWIFKLTKTNPIRPKISWLFLAKMTCIVFLIINELINYGLAYERSLPTVYFLTPIILISTYVLAGLIVNLERLNGWRHSTLVFIFWLLLFLASIVTLRSKLLFQLDSVEETNANKSQLQRLKVTSLDLINFYVSFALITLSMILSAFQERAFVKMSESSSNRKKAPEKNTSLLSMLTFWWINDLLSTGYARDLKRDDLWEIDDAEKSATVTKKLECVWNPKASQYISRVRTILENQCDATMCNENNEEVLILPNTRNKIDKEKATKQVPKPSLGWCLAEIFFFKYVGILSIKIIHDLLNFARPILLDKLISFVKDKDQNLGVGLFYIFLLCLSSLSQTLIIQHYYHSIFLLGNRLKTSNMNIVYKKSLRLSSSARKSTTVGEMTNLITTNAAAFEWSIFHFVGIVSTPLQILISSYMLWQYLGWATLVGLASMILFLPLNAYLTRLNKRLRLTRYKLSDSRIKSLNEMLAGIRVIKFMGWEQSFEKLIKSIRDKELINLVKCSFLNSLTSLTWSCAPFVVALVSFATYIYMDDKNNLDPNTAFVSLTLFSMLRFPLNFIPYIITGLIQLNVSVGRIRDFLIKDETKQSDIEHEDIPGIAVKVQDVDFGWTTNEAILKNITFEAPKGKLIAILGKVGSGKSSLLSGLLGEMHKLNEKGLVNINGSTAYVPQQAWIQNATVKDNIMFGAEYDAEFYAQIIKSCALEPDLAIMPAGDKTEIGEKGINLSGGQKQRISLARSLYAKSDIYMLDDSLSAVDSHVGKHIFDNVIGPKGLLKDNTRIFATNSLSFLPQSDYILMMESGEIVEAGTYEELKKSESGPFTEFIRTLKNTQESNLTDEVYSDENVKETKIDEKAANKTETVKPSETTQQPKVGEKIIEKEKIESGTVKFSLVLGYLRACRLWMTAIFVLLYIISYASDMGSNFWLSNWSNQVDDNHSDPESKAFRLGIYALLGFSKSIVAFVGNVCFIGMFIKATKLMHNRLLHSVLRAQIHFFDSTPLGRIVNRFTKDVEATEDAIPSSIKSLIDCFLSMFSTVVVISTSTPFFLAALVPISICYVLVQRYYVPSNRQLKRLQSASKSPIFSHFSETQSGMSTVRAYHAQETFIKRMESNIDEYFVYYYSNTVSNRWLALRLEIIGNIITIVAALFAIIQRDTLSAGLAGLSISISLTISSNLNWFVREVSEFEANITSVERINEYLEIPKEPEWSIESNKPAKDWPQNGSIELSNLTIRYRPELPPALNNLSLTINPEEKIGIVGRTGAGKSTLALALFRLVEPTSGSITIDSVPIAQLGLHDLRHRITIIPQDAVIFSGTMRANLDPFAVYKDDQIWQALRLAHLEEFVRSLQGGLEFKCDEHGSNLSAGQQQLICLARALLRKTKILVLDEATASIDHNTDELIQQTIRSEFKDCTVLTIAHRLNTIMDSSRIIVLSKGELEEFDTPQNLLANKQSSFYSMAKDAGLVKEK